VATISCRFHTYLLHETVHEKNRYGKVVHWFDVIKEVLQDSANLAKNVYKMDETGVMLSMPRWQALSKSS
jgi:hypothetical protein